MLDQTPDITILHESPAFLEENLEGNEKIRNIIEASPTNLIISGHKPWPIPYIKFRNGSQLLNVNERVVILTKKL